MLRAVQSLYGQALDAAIQASNVHYLPLLDERGVLLSASVGRVEILLGDEVKLTGGLSEDGYFSLGLLHAESVGYSPCTVHLWDGRLGSTYSEAARQGHGYAEAIFDLFVLDTAFPFGQQGFPGLQLQRTTEPQTPSLAEASAFLGDSPVTQSWVTGAMVHTPGYGYGSSLATVTFTGGGGTGASGRTILSNGVVIGVRILSTGSGYTRPPAIQIPPPAGIPEISIGIHGWLATLHVNPGYTYQIRAAAPGTTAWTNIGSPFVANETVMQRTIEWGSPRPDVALDVLNLPPDLTQLSSPQQRSLLVGQNLGGSPVLNEDGVPLAQDRGRAEVWINGAIRGSGPLVRDGFFAFNSIAPATGGFLSVLVRAWDSEAGATYDDARRAGHGYGWVAMPAEAVYETGSTIASEGFPGLQLLRPGPKPLPRPASASALIGGDAVGAVNVLDGGDGYGETSLPALFLGGGGTGAWGSTIISNGVISGVRVIFPGQGYSSPPRVLLGPSRFSESSTLEVGWIGLNLTLSPGYAYIPEVSEDGGRAWSQLLDWFVATVPSRSLTYSVQQPGPSRLYRLKLTN